MRTRTLLAAFITLALLMTAAITLAPTGTALEASGPIIIDGDEDLAAQAAARNWTGADRLADGSAERPFNITALSFDIPAGAAGISISNTTLYLNIDMCEFTSAGGEAVLLSNVSNIALIDNRFDGNVLGIYLHSASRCVVAGNTIYDSVNASISAESCSNLTIVDNAIDGGQELVSYQEYGIYLHNDHEDYEHDADVVPSENNTVARNVITGQIRFGICLELSDRCVVQQNVIENMETEWAICLYRSNYNSVIANSIGDVAGGGICIDVSNANLVERNEVTMALRYGGYGIMVAGDSSGRLMEPASEHDAWSATDNRVINNTVSGGLVNGITVYSASGNLIDRNTVHGGERAGISMEYAGQNSVTGNLIMDSESDGIFLHNTESNLIAGNTIESFAGYGYGISIDGGHEDLISGNTIAYTDYGVCLYDSFARIYGNTITVTRGVGISLNNCPGDLQGNVLIDCGIELYFEEGYDPEDLSPNLDILPNNTVNGRPVLFIKDRDMGGQSSPARQGQIILFNVTRYSVAGQDMDHGGVHLFFSDNVTVSGNTVADAEVSISLAFCENCTIEDNVIAVTFSGQDYQDAKGITADDSSRCVIRHNKITLTTQAGGAERYFDGICADDVAWFTISGNTVTIESAGGALYTTGIIMFEANDCTIAGNHLSGTRSVSEGSGIYLLISNRIGIYGNDIVNMTYIGVNLFGTHYSTVAGNHIADSGYYAISLTASTSNLVNGNWLGDNNWRSMSVGQHQAYDDSNNNLWNGPGFGNVWSDWTAPDAGRDGIVDLPYSIVGGKAQDAFPVVVTLNVTSPSSFPHYVTVPNVALSGGAQDAYGIVSVSWFVVESGASGICAGTTEWSASVPLTPGENHVRIVMVDAMGLRFVQERLVVCAPGPAIETTPGPQHYTNQSTMLVDLKVNDFAPITSGNWTHLLDGVEVARGSIEVTGAPFTFSLTRSWTLAPGTNVIVVQMNNSAGGETVYRLTAVYDTAVPSVQLDGPAGGALLGTGDVTFTWSGSDALSGILRYEVSIDGGEWVAADSGYLAAGLADGLHVMKLRATDRAGNSAEAAVEFSVDTTAPTVIITSPAEGSYARGPKVVVEYRAADAQSGIKAVELRINSGEWTDDWTVLEGLEDGTYLIEVRVTDNAGHTAVDDVTVTVDTVAPTVTSSSPSGSEVVTGMVVSVTFSEAMNKSSVSIVVDGVAGTVAWDGNVATFTPTSPLAAGTAYTVRVSGADNAGNAMEHSWQFTTTGRGEISGQIVDGDGKPIAGATVMLENGMTATTDLQGRFTLTNVPPGEHTLTVSREGYADRTMLMTLAPGQAYGLDSLEMESVSSGSPDGLLIVGVIAVIAALAGLAVLMVRRKK